MIIFLSLHKLDPLPPSSVLDISFPKDIYTSLAGCFIGGFDLKCGFNHFPNL